MNRRGRAAASQKIVDDAPVLRPATRTKPSDCLVAVNPAEDVLASSGSEDTEEYARPDAAQDPQAHDKDAANQARVPNEIAPTASTRSQAKEEKPAVAARPRPARGTSGEPRGRKEEEAQARPTWKRNKDIRDTSPTWRGVRPRPDVKEQTKEEAKMKLNQAGAARVRVNGTTGPYLRLGPTPPRPAGAQKSNSVISEQERKKPPEPNVAAKPKEAKPPAASLASPYRAPKPRSLSVGHTLQATIAAPHLVNPILVSLAPAPSKEETVDPVSTNAKACIMCLERVVTTVCVPCGHQCTCVKCSRELLDFQKLSCLVCNQLVGFIIRTYPAAQ